MPRTLSSGRVASTRIAARDMTASLIFLGGTSSRVRATTVPNLHLGCTFAAWINSDVAPTTGTSNSQIIENSLGTNSRLTLMRLGNTIRAGYYNGTAYTAKSSMSITPNTWYLAIFTWDGSATQLYMNSISQSGTSAPVSGVGGALCIGARAADNTESWLGRLTKPMIWNRPLTQTEVTNFYQTGIPPTSGLVRRYEFDETSGTTVADSASGDTGTITGANWSSNVPMRARKRSETPSITVKTLSGLTSTAEVYNYEMIRVNTDSQFIPNLVVKEFAFDYERAGTSGTNFKPTRENTLSVSARKPRDVVINAGGWMTTGNVGEIEGPQIKDGVVYHDFTLAMRGAEALGFKADGSVKTYSMLDGDTTTSMLADGVIYCFSFGPLLVRNGVQCMLESQPLWDTFNTSPSSRQILGVTSTGDIIILTTTGSSGVSGIKGNDISKLALDSGCYNAIMLDGGGSAQSVVGGTVTHASSDGSPRPVPDFLTINTRANRSSGLLRV